MKSLLVNREAMLACAGCDFLLEPEMFETLGACPICGSQETSEVEECENCGASFPMGRSCAVCSSPGPRNGISKRGAAAAASEDEFDVDSFLSRLGDEGARAPPVRGGTRPREDERVLPPTRVAARTWSDVNARLRPRDERLPPADLLRELRDEGKWLLA